MNVWALQKDSGIKLILMLLIDRLGEDAFDIAEGDDLDYRAVRILNTREPHVSAYLFTYGQADGEYGLHLEFPQESGGWDISSSDDIHEGIGREALVDLLAMHFGIVSEVS